MSTLDVNNVTDDDFKKIAIGESKRLLMSPLYMNMVFSSFINQGCVYVPYITKKLYVNDFIIYHQVSSSELARGEKVSSFLNSHLKKKGDEMFGNDDIHALMCSNEEHTTLLFGVPNGYTVSISLQTPFKEKELLKIANTILKYSNNKNYSEEDEYY
jgi:hypothetical protein